MRALVAAGDAKLFWLLGLTAAASVAALTLRDPLACGIALMGSVYLLTLVRYPELNLILYYIAGKVTFEERLALGWGVSANQILQLLLVPTMVFAVAARGDLRNFPRWTIGFLTAFTIVMTSGLLYTTNLEYGRLKVATYLLLVLPCAVFLALRVRDFAGIEKVMLLFLLVCTVMMLMGVRNIGAMQQGERLAVLGGGANVYSRLLGTGVLLLSTFGLLLRIRGHRCVASVLMLVVAPGFLVTMYFAGSKGPLLGLLVSFLLFTFLNRFLRKTLLVVAVVAGAIAIGSTRSPVFDQTLKLVTASRLFLNPEDEQSYGSYGSRLDFYSYSAGLVARSPVLGVGPGAWGVQRKLFEEKIYPHNIIVELACEYGVGMVCFFIGFLAWLLWRARLALATPMPRSRYVILSGLLSCLAFWMVNVQVSGDVVDNRNLWIFVLLAEVGIRIVLNGREQLAALMQREA